MRSSSLVLKLFNNPSNFPLPSESKKGNDVETALIRASDRISVISSNSGVRSSAASDILSSMIEEYLSRTSLNGERVRVKVRVRVRGRDKVRFRVRVRVLFLRLEFGFILGLGFGFGVRF